VSDPTPAAIQKRTTRPDPARVLAGLKDFQRRTVEHVHHRFFLDSDSTDRFLVADEVGLGKTLIARGVVALALEEMWGVTERLDVVYICSNAEIAQQNLNRLRVVEGYDYARPTRLALLPLELHGLRERKLNFVSLTPGTSFEAHSAMGRSSERQVLYLMLADAWDLRGKRSLNVFCGDAGRDGFEQDMRWLRRARRIDEELSEAFIVELERSDTECRARGEPTLRERYEALLEPFARRQRPRISDPEVRDAQRELIGALRHELARTCVDALEPDLVILDEFQRFKHLLNTDSEAGELANTLFDYRDLRTGHPARTLLLSATPYKAYVTGGELDDTSHLEDFMATIDFLARDDAEVARVRELLGRHRSLLVRWGGEGVERELREVKTEIERRLGRVIARTERLAESADRNGMLREVSPVGFEVKPPDLDAYVTYQDVARALEQDDTLEYWKSAPYLLNLMDEYKLKRELQGVAESPSASPAGALIARATRRGSPGLISWDEIESYEELDPGNARMRSLAAETIDAGAWQLLWIAPSLPYYELAGPYADQAAQALTKRLVFSSWAVVPKAISLVLSYLAERRMATAFDPRTRNLASIRKNRGQLLRVSLDSEGRLAGMPVLALMYPSFALAEAVDPALLAQMEGGVPDRERTLEIAAGCFQERIDELTRSAPREGRVDERWYWAAPLMLDWRLDEGATRGWFERPSLARSWGVGASDESTGAHWAEHVEAALKAASGDIELGVPPEDLARVVGQSALAAPGVAALRALTREAADPGAAVRDGDVRLAAARAGAAFRTLFNTPEAAELVRALHRHGTYWREMLRYCVDGCLQAVLDEFAHVQREVLGHVSGPTTPEVAGEVSESIRDAVGIRTTRASVDLLESDGDSLGLRRESMRARFALRFGDQRSDEGADLARSDQVRTAFNSPFWPFVLASTSVGQEGLDFHLYSHAVVHWNLPNNPVDLEQREGRVHRYKNHAVRRNLGAEYGKRVLAEGASTVWRRVFELAEADRPAGLSELWPFWIYTPSGPGTNGSPAMIERHVLALPLSRDQRRFAELRHALTLYRSVLGQARQEDLLEVLSSRIDPDDWDRVVQLLRIDLTPPIRPPVPLADGDRVLENERVTNEVIEFRRDDGGYRAWIAANPNGFVLNTTPGVSASYLKLHRASCLFVSDPDQAQGAWTERDYIKVCSTDRDALNRWVDQRTGARPAASCSCWF
jgi:hypothetical protein